MITVEEQVQATGLISDSIENIEVIFKNVQSYLSGPFVSEFTRLALVVKAVSTTPAVLAMAELAVIQAGVSTANAPIVIMNVIGAFAAIEAIMVAAKNTKVVEEAK